MAAFADGDYDVFIVDAREDGDTLHLELTVTSGEHRGEVVTLRGPRSLGRELDLLGMPATLVVRAGLPRVAIDR